MESLFWKGLAAGLLLGLPTGPAGLLVLRGWLRSGVSHGMLAAAGMALADGAVAGVVAWGLQAAWPELQEAAAALRLAAGCLLILTGTGILFFEKDEKDLGRPGWTWTFLWPGGLVVTNPGIWAAYGSLFFAMGAHASNAAAAVWAGLGAAAGVALLWQALGILVRRWKRRTEIDEAKFTRWSDRVTSAILISLGLVSLFFPVTI